MRSVLLGTVLVSMLSQAFGASKDLGNGYSDHGVAVPISNHRGTVATVDGQGRNVLLMWLMDHRGGYELLLIDATNGKAEQFPIPFKNKKLDSPYASLLSSANRFYTHFGDYFVEFDPVKRAFTFCKKTTPQMAMGMTEDDKGVIWSVTYPQSGVVSFDPKTRQFRDYGHVYKQNWNQYQRYMAADDTGWIYFAVGETASQIVALDPATGKATPMFPEQERVKGTAYLYRDQDGKVYGQTRYGQTGNWYEFYKGAGKKIADPQTSHPKQIITANQALFHSVFPDGSKVRSCDLVERRLVVEDAHSSATKEFSFDYDSEGAIVMGLALAPDSTICGGTCFPMRYFCLDPKADKLINRPAYGQWNTVERQGDRFFVGGYPGGFLLEWDPSKPWVNTDTKEASSNPAYLTKISPTIHRPMSLLAEADGKYVIMGGTPDYGYTGGGLLFWDRQQRKQTVIEDKDVIPNQSTLSMVSLPGGKLLGGTTTEPGTGGEKKAKEAELYIMDSASKKVDWHGVVLPGVEGYTDMYVGDKGLIYGIADQKVFFVFDPAKRVIVHKQEIGAEFGLTVSQQGPRVFVTGPNNRVFVVCVKGVAELERGDSYKLKLLAPSPIKAECGGDYFDGRVYFASGSHLYSYQLEQGKK